MTPTPEILKHAISITMTGPDIEHHHCRWCSGGGYVRHPKIGNDFHHMLMCPVPALVASEQARQRAETIVDVSRRLRAVWARRGHGCAEEKLLLADLAHAVDALAPDAPKEKP